jgi:hypothetical protein
MKYLLITAKLLETLMSNKKVWSSIFLLLFFFTNSKPVSAEIIKDIRVSGLRIQIKRTAHKECERGFNYFFTLEGVIGPDAREILSRIMSNTEQCTLKKINKKVKQQVYLKSAGGYMLDGFKLGEFFMENNIQTEIGENDICASACATAFLGGTTRRISGNGVLLFHSPYRSKGIGIDCSNKTDQKIFENYMIKFMGQKDGKYVFERAMSYCSDESGWAINKDAAEIFNISNYGKNNKGLNLQEEAYIRSLEK